MYGAPQSMTMKKINSQVTYIVPNWNFCNNDNLLPGGRLQKDTCQFCAKTKSGARCLLYNKSLSVNDGFISKVRECCKATAGFASTIDNTKEVPTVGPLELMEQTINLYDKTVKDLMAQSYPRAIAEKVARKHVLGK